ncbi:response regulator [Adhaeretor mobilis]|uniref:Response regulator protein VraR n=1 Tax=Adhaeretor mobilis TaxID=1930276 RepID=A0A517MY74_9BACT|nr:response regulator transcription factor [Adhaeretor mobilis]QDS99832.1 Response regulator protein VraR [Adhaeretor mobilis]
MPKRVLIIDDHEVVRIGLRSLLESAEMKVVGEASDGERGIKLAESKNADLVILDIRMPGTDGLSCLTTLRSKQPELPVLVLSGYDNPTYFARARALGAVGYLLKSIPAQEIVAAVQSAAAGEQVWTREGMRRVTGALATPRSQLDLEAPLTKREDEVLKQLALGLSNKEIALALGISYETVKEHVQHILRKLGVVDRTQAAVWAVRRGLV